MHKKMFRTDRELKAIKPASDWYDVRDEITPNLSIRVGPRNSKGRFRRTFILVTRFPGAKYPTRQALGEYGLLTLEEAREKAGEWRKLIAKGIDPRGAERRQAEEAERTRAAEKQAEKERQSRSFDIVAEEYIQRRIRKQRRAEISEREIRRQLIGPWQDKAVTEITRDDVRELIENLADRGTPYEAHSAFGHARTFFNWLIETGKFRLETSPCDRLRPSKLIGEKKPRQRVHSDDELRALWRVSGRLGYPFGPIYRMLILTGQRRSEVTNARWREFHPDLVLLLRERAASRERNPIDWTRVPNAIKLWTVSAERFKSDAPHMVPLGDEACAILERLPTFRRGDHLFSTTLGEKPVAGFSKAKARLDSHMTWILRAMARMRGDDPRKVDLEHFVNHDLRRTLRTRLSSLRVPDAIAELVIGHGKRGLQRVYDQHRYIDEMREALTAWEAKLRDIVTPTPQDKVVKLRARA